MKSIACWRTAIPFIFTISKIAFPIKSPKLSSSLPSYNLASKQFLELEALFTELISSIKLISQTPLPKVAAISLFDTS